MVSCVHKKRWGLRFTFFGRFRFIKVFGHKFIKFWGIMLIFFGVLGSQKSVGALAHSFWGTEVHRILGVLCSCFFWWVSPSLKNIGPLRS